jgi:hypothetical protein
MRTEPRGYLKTKFDPIPWAKVPLTHYTLTTVACDIVHMAISFFPPQHLCMAVPGTWKTSLSSFTSYRIPLNATCSEKSLCLGQGLGPLVIITAFSVALFKTCNWFFPFAY